ncbi:MAG: hypothetical protein IBX72_03415 [Nitrospirae bacterium]|jgi:predicted CXXCH cytochrome family protein|nr:hypothetical protein [Nitrospirota bacterium]
MNRTRANIEVQKITPLHPPFNKGGRGEIITLYSILYALCSMLLVVLAFSGLAYAQSGDLIEKIPDLCYKCHTNLEESHSKAYVHFPFSQGKCTSCHDSHAGKIKGLIKENINSLCMNCHESIKQALKKDFIHRALKQGACTDCHNSHSGEHKNLLVKAQKDLCWSCHEPLKEQLKKTNVHIPFRDGECSSCHNPHASSNEDQMISSPNTLCKKCHSPGCKAGGVSITYSTDKLDCTSCHGGHASNTKGLLGPYGHSDFLDKRCEKCHDPFLPDKKITIRMSGKSLCLDCHKKDPVFIRDDDVHLDESKGGCIICHNYHASKKTDLTVKESQTCIRCHEDTEKRTVLMERALRSIRCVPVKERKCFECHIPPHSLDKLYFREDEIMTCAQCHEAQHRVTHPLGPDVRDPRNGKPVTCKTCHSMHSARAGFMLYFDRKRQLCIQCHKK